MLARKKQEWAGWVEQEYRKCKAARSTFERQWHINLAFYGGRQYISPINVPGQGFKLVSPKAPPWRVRLVINKIRVAVRTEASKLTSSRPIPVVVPATTEDEDFNAAQVAEQILKTEFATQDFDRTLRSFVWWGVITGTAFLKSYWSSEAVDPMAQPAPIPNPFDPQAPPIEQPPVKGKIIIEKVSPFHIFVPDMLCEDLEKQPYLIHVTTKHPLWVERNFGFKPHPDAKAHNDVYEAAVLAPAGQEDHFDAVLVKEVWLKPFAHADFPEGGVLTIINNRVVQHQERWPWPFKEYPFYKYEGIPTGGFYTESTVTDLIPLQKEYNKTKSQMVEIKNMMGKPKLLAARGSINPRQISSEPGQAILYTPGFQPPIVMPGVEIPVSMGVELDRLASDFDDISGQHEITRGNTPSQVTSGTAISFLQEQDDSKLSYQVASIEHCMQKLGTHYLKYAANYWKEERLLRVVGKNSDFEARSWKGSDLRGNTDVRIQSGSALPQSRAAKTAMLTEFMTNGWVDPTVGMELLELGGFEKVMEDFLTDKRQAQRENMRMAEFNAQEVAQLVDPPVGPDGQPQDPEEAMDPVTGMPWQPQPPLPPNSYDNHEAHIHFHNQFRKTQQFELLEEPIKKAFELHVQAHQMALMMPQAGAAGIVNNPPVGPGEGAAQQEATEGGPQQNPQ